MLGQLGPVDWLPDAVARYSDLFTDLVSFVAIALAVFLVGRLLVVPGLLRVVRSRNRNNPTLVTAIETYLSVLLVTLSLVAGLAAAGHLPSLLDTNSAIVVAALTFVFGVAGQEVFGSLISGLFLVADPDFRVGDWISWPGGEGIVEAVDFRVTRIRTRDNETVTVPNTELTTNALTRPFARDRVRLVERAYVPYDEDTERALLELRQVAVELDGVLDEPAPRARIEELGPDTVTVRAVFWIENPDRSTVDDVSSDFRRELKRRFREENLTMAPAAEHELSGTVTVNGVGETAAGDD